MPAERNRTFITCRHCQAFGTLTVDHNGGANDMFVEIAGDFHTEQGRLPGGKLAVVCNNCDQIHDLPLAAPA